MPAYTDRLLSLPEYPLAKIPEQKRELIARGMDVIDLGAGDADLAFVLDPGRSRGQDDCFAFPDHARGRLQEDERLLWNFISELLCVLAVVASDADDFSGAKFCGGHLSWSPVEGVWLLETRFPAARSRLTLVRDSVRQVP